MYRLIGKVFVRKLGFIVFILTPLLLQGQVDEKHVQKISRYIEKFNAYSKVIHDSMFIDGGYEIEVLTRFSDLAHEAYLHAFYISGMLDILTKIDSSDERTPAINRIKFYIKGAVLFMKIADKMLLSDLNLSKNKTVISMGMQLKEDAEKFATELETVKGDLEYDYTYNPETYNNK